MTRLRKVSFAAAAAIPAALVALSIYGANSGAKPGEPPIRVSGCYKGFWPTLAFGAGLKFGTMNEVFGPDFYRTRAVAISWPGGVLGAFIVPLCAEDIPEPDRKDG